MAVKFRLNERGVEQVIHGRGVAGHLEQVGKLLVGKVEQNAPHGTGTFAGSIEALPPERDRRGTVVTVHSTDWAAHLVEFGSRNNPPYAPFRKGAGALGLRLRGGGDRR